MLPGVCKHQRAVAGRRVLQGRGAIPIEPLTPLPHLGRPLFPPGVERKG